MNGDTDVNVLNLDVGCFNIIEWFVWLVLFKCYNLDSIGYLGGGGGLEWNFLQVYSLAESVVQSIKKLNFIFIFY